MKGEAYSVRASVWLYPGDNPWHFITIEMPEANDIRREYTWPRRGFGTIPVQVSIGKTSWKTSLFPEKNGNYILPLKKEVRNKEKIHAGDTISISIEVIT